MKVVDERYAVSLSFSPVLLHVELDVPPLVSLIFLLEINQISRARGFQNAHFTFLRLFRCNKSNLLITDTQRTDILLEGVFYI